MTNVSLAADEELLEKGTAAVQGNISMNDCTPSRFKSQYRCDGL